MDQLFKSIPGYDSLENIDSILTFLYSKKNVIENKDD